MIQLILDAAFPPQKVVRKEPMAQLHNPGALFIAVREAQYAVEQQERLNAAGFERHEPPVRPGPGPEWTPPRIDEEAESAPISPPAQYKPPLADLIIPTVPRYDTRYRAAPIKPPSILPTLDSDDSIVIEKPGYKLPMSVTPWLAGQYEDPETQAFLDSQSRWWLAGGGVVLAVSLVTAYVVAR